MQLYEPGASTRDLKRTQETLHDIQRSELGWAYANAFLASPIQIVRFFGALTFTIKFNHDSDNLQGGNDEGLFDKVMSRYVQLIEEKDSAMVIRKLCSALVAYYLRPKVTWDRIVMHLVERLAKAQNRFGNPVNEEFAELIQRLDDNQLFSMLWFVETLVHDLALVDTSSLQG